MEDISIKQNQLSRLKKELEDDKKSLEAVPERFINLVQAQIHDKEKKISKLELEINILIEANLSDRIETIRKDFEHVVNDFIINYPFLFPVDREIFLNTVLLEASGKEINVIIKGLESRSTHGYFNKRLVVTFPDGSQIEGNKSTDTFIQTITHIGIDKVDSLGISYLGTPLISKTKHNKYQQKKINDTCYILTTLSKEKKRELLETIGKKLKIPLTARYVKD